MTPGGRKREKEGRKRFAPGDLGKRGAGTGTGWRARRRAGALGGRTWDARLNGRRGGGAALGIASSKGSGFKRKWDRGADPTRANAGA